MTRCPVVGCPNSSKEFASDKGVRVHISISHPNLSNWMKSNARTLPLLLVAIAENRVPPPLIDHTQLRMAPESDEERPRDASDEVNISDDDSFADARDNIPLIASPSPSASSPPPPVQQIHTCDVCDLALGSRQALSAHYQSHPAQANLRRVDRLIGDRSQPSPNPLAPSEHPPLPPDIRTQIDRFYRDFSRIEASGAQLDSVAFDNLVTELIVFVGKAKDSLPNKPKCPDHPIHPNTKMYAMRIERKRVRDLRAAVGLPAIETSIPLSGYSRSSNPSRTARSARERRQLKYEYELCQYNFAFQRKLAARMAMGSDKPSKCDIPIDDLQKHYGTLFGSRNDSTLDSYPFPRTESRDIVISADDVKRSLRSMNPNTTATEDSITVVALRALNINHIIASIINIMLSAGHVPACLSRAKTCLIPKSGCVDLASISSWRPITMFSVLRRVIEKTLDYHLRRQIDLCPNQRGFILGKPGTHLNAGHVDGYLKHAKSNKKNLVLVFLDVAKAFDSIGHEHIMRSLESQGVARNLRSVINALLVNNTIQIRTKLEQSNPIRVLRSVPQGSPTSPILFNVAINYIYQELTQPAYAIRHGYIISDDLPPATILGFADDQVLVANSFESAKAMVELTMMLFDKIGLKINPSKSQVIGLIDGALVPRDLILSGGETISSISSPDDRVKYLGCSFSDELKFNNNIVIELTNQLNSLASSPLLKKHQKLTIIDQFIVPQLTYHLQAAAINRIPSSSIETLDKNIRATVKAIVGLPTSTSTAMLYSPKRFRGLGIVRVADEVELQTIGIAQKLLTIDDQTFHSLHDCNATIARCKATLNTPDLDSIRKMRKILRERHFGQWASLSFQGSGVQHFATVPKSNNFMSTQGSLSDSEFSQAVKLSLNYANLRGVPGSPANATSKPVVRCRRCDSENSPEVLSHILGACSFNALRRNARHDAVVTSIASLLTAKGFTCHIEVVTSDGTGGRRADIIALDPADHTKAYVIDPTVRYETNADVGSQVQAEKAAIYDRCFPDLTTKFNRPNWETIGLWFGARGAVSQNVMAFFDRFSLDKNALVTISENIIKAAIYITHNHIYAP